jgi:hypothetical protein
MTATATLDFKVDTSTPTAAVSAPAITVPGSTGRTFRVSWSGADSVSGVASYEVQYATSGSWVTWRASTTDTSAWFTGALGSKTFFRVRAFDAAGNVGAWSAPASAVVPFDQGKARFSGSWKTARSSAYYLGSSRYSTKKGGYATLSFTTGTLYLVAKKGPSMGKMAIYLGGSRVGTVDLHSSTNKYRQVIKLVSRSVVYGAPAPKARTVKLVNLGVKGHSRVEIDGFALKN